MDSSVITGIRTWSTPVISERATAMLIPALVAVFVFFSSQRPPADFVAYMLINQLFSCIM